MKKSKREVYDCIIGGLWGAAIVGAACWAFGYEYQSESDPERQDLYTRVDAVAQMPKYDTTFLAPAPSDALETPNPNCIVGIMKANREFYMNTYEYHVIDEPTMSLILKVRNGVCTLLGI